MGNGAVNRPKPRSVVTSPWTGIDVPTCDIITYLSDVFMERARDIAFIDASTDESVTFGQVWDWSMHAAARLLELGFPAAGGCLAVCSLNAPEVVPVLLAVWRLNGHVALINPQESIEMMNRALKLSKARLVMGHVDVLYKIAGACKDTQVEKTIVKGEFIYRTPDVAVVVKHGVDYNNCIDVDELFDSPPAKTDVATAREITVRPKTASFTHGVAALLFTGGVLGEPKAVEMTNKGLVYCAFSFSHPAFHRVPKYVILYETLAHVFGLGVLLGALKQGATTILMRRYDLDLYFQTIVKYKVDTLHLMPPMGLLFSQQRLEVKGSLSFVREVLYYSEGAPLSVLVEEQICKKIKSNLFIRQFYGLTETSGPVCMVPSKHVKKPTQPGSSGYLLPGWEVIIVSMISGDVASVGEKGEVCVKGPYLMKGYRGENMGGDSHVLVFDSKGWLHTGDYGYCTTGGEVHVLCRLDDVIKYQGLDVIPTELEATLLTCPLGVWAAGVIGFPDRNDNEVPMAWVLKNPDMVGTNVEIELWMAERVPDFKQVRGGVKLINVMPYSLSGKVLRKSIKKEELASRMVVKSSKKLARSNTIKALKVQEKDKLPKEV